MKHDDKLATTSGSETLVKIALALASRERFSKAELVREFKLDPVMWMKEISDVREILRRERHIDFRPVGKGVYERVDSTEGILRRAARMRAKSMRTLRRSGEILGCAPAINDMSSEELRRFQCARDKVEDTELELRIRERRLRRFLPGDETMTPASPATGFDFPKGKDTGKH